MFVTGTPLRASEDDARIAASFRQTYVYQTYLKQDTIRVEAKDGVVTLTGTVADDSHKALAQETVARLPESPAWIIDWRPKRSCRRRSGCPDCRAGEAGLAAPS